MFVIIHREWVSNNKGRQGAFLSTLSTERCVHNACRCHEAHKAKSGLCSAWSCLESWTDTWEKEWRIEWESLERIWSSTLGCCISLRKACGLSMLCLYTDLSKWCGLRENKGRSKWNPLLQSFVSLCRVCVTSTGAAGAHCKLCRKNWLYILSYTIRDSHINVGKMEQWMEKERQIDRTKASAL